MTVNISVDQRMLLEKIKQYSDPNRRTDKLAVCMQQFGKHWDTSHTAFVGLSLRSLGYVTTFKDSGQYAQWNITPLGKAALCELNNMKQQPIPVETKGKYAVYESNDGSYSECVSLEAARALADKCATETPGELVYVVQVVESYKAEVVVKKVQP